VGAGGAQKGARGMWAGDVVGFLGTRARGSATVREEDEANRVAPWCRERVARARGNSSALTD
jgi:hypothetical protein